MTERHHLPTSSAARPYSMGSVGLSDTDTLWRETLHDVEPDEDLDYAERDTEPGIAWYPEG